MMNVNDPLQLPLSLPMGISSLAGGEQAPYAAQASIRRGCIMLTVDLLTQAGDRPPLTAEDVASRLLTVREPASSSPLSSSDAGLTWFPAGNQRNETTLTSLPPLQGPCESFFRGVDMTVIVGETARRFLPPSCNGPCCTCSDLLPRTPLTHPPSLHNPPPQRGRWCSGAPSSAASEQAPLLLPENALANLPYAVLSNEPVMLRVGDPQAQEGESGVATMFCRVHGQPLMRGHGERWAPVVQLGHSSYVDLPPTGCGSDGKGGTTRVVALPVLCVCVSARASELSASTHLL